MIKKISIITSIVLAFIITNILLVFVVSCSIKPKKNKDPNDGLIIKEKVDLSKVKVSAVDAGEGRIILKNSKIKYGVEISYYNYSSLNSKTVNGLFGEGAKVNEEGYKSFGKKIKEVLYHGPEIDQLAGIVFGDTKVIDKSANGLYINNTQQIFINIEFFKKYNSNSNFTQEQKINSLLSSTIHEYGHHIMNTYANSMKTDDLKSSKDIYQKVYDEKGAVKRKTLKSWNKNFEESFKKALHYDNPNFYPKVKEQFGRKGEVNSIGNGNSAYNLFNFANSNNSLSGEDNIKNSGFFVKKTFKNSSQTTLNVSSAFDSGNNVGIPLNTLNYMYSLEELSTRDLEQLMYAYPIGLENTNMWGRMVPKDLTKNDPFWLDPFTIDLLRNYIVTNPSNAFELFKAPKTNKPLIYMSDNPWGGMQIIIKNNGEYVLKEQKPTNIPLYEAYAKLIGFHNGANSASINQIYAKNDWRIYDNTTEQSTDWDPNWLSKVKVSGFLPKDSENYTGLMIDNSIYTFTKQNVFLNKKTSILSGSTKEEKQAYILDDFINTTNLGNSEQIFWWNDQNKNGKYESGEKIAMNAKNINQNNSLTTYRSFMEGSENKYANITTNKGNVYFNKNGY